MESRASICTARTISISLAGSVRGRGSSSRAVCMVSVEAPELTRPVASAEPAARATASGSTPGWIQKRASSMATSRF